MSEVPDLIQAALAAQQQVLRAWGNLSTRQYSQIKRKYGELGHALDELDVKADAANMAIVAEDGPGPAFEVPQRIFTLPPGYGFSVAVLNIDDEWKLVTVDANLSLVGEGGGVTFYESDEVGMHTVVHYPAGWYGTIQPVLLPEAERYSLPVDKPKRKKFSQMTGEERAEAIRGMRERLNRAEASGAPESATYVSEQDKIRKDLAAGEFPPDDLGTDAGGTPIAPPERVKDVWGKGEPPSEPTGLPVTDDEHEAQLAHLRRQSDLENYGEIQPNSPDMGPDAPPVKAVTTPIEDEPPF